MDDNILKVQVDLARGAYIVSRRNGEQVEEIVKKIKDEGNNNYDKVAMNRRRKEIPGKRWVPTDLLKRIDPVLYDALEEFDQKYGTEYRKAYLEATTMQIPYSGVSELKKKRQYEKRASGIRQEELKKAGISIEYDIKVLGSSKDLSIMDRFRALRIANMQKKVGATVNANNKQNETIVDKIKGFGATISQRINAIKRKRIDKKLEATQKRLKASIPRDANGLIDDVPELTEEELAAINAKQLEQAGVVIDIKDSAVVADPKTIIIPDPMGEEKLPEEIRPEEQQQGIKIQPKEKKTMSRSKSIQASKKAAREAGKMKNSYQDRIKAKAEARAVAAEGRKKAEAKRAEDARKAAQEEQERIAREREEQIARAIEAEEARKAAEEEARLANERKLSVRFTRKLRNAQDSIRNKVHIPKLDINGKQRKIAGTLTAVAILALVGTGIGVATSRANADAIERQPETTPIVEVVESESPEKKDLEHLVHRDNLGVKVDTATNLTGTRAPVEDGAGTAEEKSDEDIEKEYLSSIRVGSNMKIESGKYFASPDGTGNFGHFENYTDGVKQITIIDVITREGVIVVTDPEVSLYDLKQQYPDAKFSYHFEFIHSDGSKTTLGWLTENSMEQDIEIGNPQQVDEGR